MTVTDTVSTHEKRFRNPVVDGFYRTVIAALEGAPDGASAAAEITAEFQLHHESAMQIQQALTGDVRRLSADDSAKASMLAHAGRYAGRMLEEHLRGVGMLHAHHEVESRMHDLAGQLDATHPEISAQIREILTSIRPPETPAAPAGPVVVASTVDTRWRTGWFRRAGLDEPGIAPGPLQPLPFAGWVLVAARHDDAGQCVQSAFLLGGSWFTKDELADHGLILSRID